MKAVIYQQSYDDSICELIVDPSLEYTEMICRECNGSGIFHIADDDYQPCNLCKTSGKEYVSLV